MKQVVDTKMVHLFSKFWSVYFQISDVHRLLLQFYEVELKPKSSLFPMVLKVHWILICAIVDEFY